MILNICSLGNFGLRKGSERGKGVSRETRRRRYIYFRVYILKMGGRSKFI